MSKSKSKSNSSSEKTISNNARDQVVMVFADAYSNAENTGSKISDVCEIARKIFGGKDIGKDDVDYIVEKVASARGWTDVSAKVRKSEARKVLATYMVLPEGIANIRETHGSCNWRDALKLATKLVKSQGNLQEALAAFSQEGAESKKATPQGRAAGALKAWFKVAKGTDKKNKILEAAQLLGLKLGVKLDA